jgi:hypothetical protein
MGMRPMNSIVGLTHGSRLGLYIVGTAVLFERVNLKAGLEKEMKQ